MSVQYRQSCTLALTILKPETALFAHFFGCVFMLFHDTRLTINNIADTLKFSRKAASLRRRQESTYFSMSRKYHLNLFRGYADTFLTSFEKTGSMSQREIEKMTKRNPDIFKKNSVGDSSYGPNDQWEDTMKLMSTFK